MLFLLGLRLALYFLFPNQTYKQGNVVTLETVLDQEPGIMYGKQILKAGNINIYAPTDPELHFGDKIEIAGLIECGNKGQECRRLVINKPLIKIVTQNASNWWMKLGFTVRTRFVGVFERILEPDQANLLSGIVLGNLGLNRQFKDRLANVGLTHVVAASGMNVSLFSGFVFWLCSGLKIRRGLKVILTIIMILFYSTITGFAPPIVRAAIMAIMSLIGQMLGRQKWGGIGLLISAYLMLWVDPGLIGNASFLLSFFAMAGQIILGGIEVKLPNFGKSVTGILAFLTGDLVQSLAAILATFPIVMMFFAKFSLVSLFTNTLVLWTVEPLMILGGLAGIAGLISIELSEIIAIPAGVLLSFFLRVVDLFGKEPRFLLRVTGIDWTFILGYYLVLGAVIMSFRERQKSLKIARKMSD